VEGLLKRIEFSRWFFGSTEQALRLVEGKK
jgi:hypothetical protein